MKTSKQDMNRLAAALGRRPPGKAFDIIGIAAILVIMCLFIWGAYALAKNLSYSWWYEDMVIETIHQQVQSQCLIPEES